MSEATDHGTNFTAEEFELFARHPSSRPWAEIPAPDKARFKSIRNKLKAIAQRAADLNSTRLGMKAYASLYSPNGRSATDLWCCIYPTKVPNKSFGLQFALILNSNGAEFCCCLGAGTSQVSDPAEAAQLSQELDRTKVRLKELDPGVSDRISAAVGEEWDFRKQWRLALGTKNFSGFNEWAQYASSNTSSGASISKNLDIATVVRLGSTIGEEFQRYARMFMPLIEAIYDKPRIESVEPSGVTLSSLTSREAVLITLREFDELGRDKFLKKYGYGAALEYFLVHDGRRYDSKAVAGVAVGKQFSEHGPLRNDEFSGGLASVAAKLRDLGFEVVQESTRITPSPSVEDTPVIRQPRYSVDDFTVETKISKPTIERWLARLQRKRQLILQGPPGTGKTFIAERLARTLVSDTIGLWDIVQFHPSYAYEDFMQGIRPRTVSGALTYEVEPGRFLEFCERASKTGAPAVLIIDEINRANLSRVFGELMYLLEYREKSSPLASGGKPFCIPKNVYLIGTMNTADRSIALVDHALRRRFSFIYLEPDYEVLRAHLTEHELPVDSLVRTLKAINAAIEDRNYWIGISFFLSDGNQLRTTLPEIWRGEIEPYLEEYFYDRLDRAATFQWDSLIKKELAEWA
jgi:MoxR-like ATPase